MTPLITYVKTVSPTVLELTYENGQRRNFDIKSYLETGRFKELNSEAMFRTARVSFDTVEWANGLDIDPEELYENSVPIGNEAAERNVPYQP